MDRRPFLRDRALREEVHQYIGGILGNLDCQPIIVGGVEDHVHLLCSLSRTCDAASNGLAAPKLGEGGRDKQRESEPQSSLFQINT
jgi:hypothetical protein